MHALGLQGPVTTHLGWDGSDGVFVTRHVSGSMWACVYCESIAILCVYVRISESVRPGQTVWLYLVCQTPCVHVSVWPNLPGL